MVGIAFRNSVGKAQGIFLVIGVAHIVHVAVVGVLRIAIAINHIYRRELFVQPYWRRANGNIEDDFDSCVIQFVHHFVEPFEIELPFGRFVAVPSQVAKSHTSKTGLFH